MLPNQIFSGNRAKFVLFGDSLTQTSFSPGGWGNLLADHYARQVDVVSRGLSGYNTRWAKHILPVVFAETQAPPPDLVTVFFGANDAALADGPDARQHVPLDEYKSNLEAIVRHVEKMKSKHAVLITPPPVDGAAWANHHGSTQGGNPEGPDRCSEETEKYASACISVGEKMGYPVLDLFSLLGGKADWEKHLCDGLHFNQKGHQFVFEMLLALLREKFEDLRSENMPLDFPLHSDIDHLNFASSLSIRKS
ncbi:hypothetical protein BSKO_05410 [Bryopsis sp. KO-2023]|nr:hypothetical protein BSKO_05410 [Bryopsis sp. KO-2023]